MTQINTNRVLQICNGVKYEVIRAKKQNPDHPDVWYTWVDGMSTGSWEADAIFNRTDWDMLKTLIRHHTRAQEVKFLVDHEMFHRVEVGHISIRNSLTNKGE